MAAKDTKVTVRIASGGIVRLNNSRNGNPRYEINCVVAPGTPDVRFTRYITMSDTSDAYGIMNGWHGKRYRSAVLTLTPAGRVRHLRYVDAEDQESTMDMVVLEGSDLDAFLGSVGAIDHSARAGGDIRKISFAIDDGLKVKINEEMWSAPLGEVKRVRV